MIKITEAKLLIVDDDEQTCENLRDIFQEVGYDVTITFNGREATKRIEKMIHDVAFIDINLPDTDAFKDFQEIN
ncbi:MAG: response regulator [Promethearchaeota archaeon]